VGISKSSGSGLPALVVEAIDGLPIGAAHQMAIGVNRDLDRMMAELIFHVGEAFAVLDEERCVGVAKVMDSKLSKS